jgi:hypothetical protein
MTENTQLREQLDFLLEENRVLRDRLSCEDLQAKSGELGSKFEATLTRCRRQNKQLTEKQQSWIIAEVSKLERELNQNKQQVQ